MSKKKYLHRYKTIIDHLRNRHYATFEEIEERLKQNLFDNDINDGYSLRTFQRDKLDIYQIYNIYIEYDRSRKAYHIETDKPDWASQRMMESFDVINTIKISKVLSDIIEFEKHTQSGSNHLHGIIHAVQNRYKLQFDHQSFWKDKSSNRTVEPYGVKEYKRRWYMVAKDTKDGRIKTFGLDRITNLYSAHELFLYPKGFSISQLFQHAYGIILGDKGQQAEEVILSFTPEQGKYIKSLPLHHSQKVLIDNDNEYRISLTVYITFDLEMDIRAWGENVEVLAPEDLRLAVKASLLQASQQYQ
jgi:hypothetical protein